MRRVASVLLTSAFLLMALATPAAADATPVDERRVREDVPLADTLIVLDAAIGCGTFDVRVEDISGKVTYVFITEDRHGNILERVIYHTVTEYTNLTTGASFQRRFDSVGNYLTRADGSVRIIGRNDILVWGDELPSHGPGVWLIDGGRAVFEYAADGSFVSTDFQFGDVTDVCQLLS